MVLLMDFLGGEPSNKDRGSVPNNLDNFTWGQFGNVDFHISISIVSGPTIQPTNYTYGVEPCEIEETCVDDGIE